MEDRQSIFQILGKLPSGMLILSTRRAELETGMLVSWVMQAGFEPPTITVALLRHRYVGQWLSEKCPFVLNLLEEGQTSLLRHFSKGFSPEQRPFANLEVERTASGIPTLIAALGYIECEPTHHMDSGDHRIFLAKVTGGRLMASRQPMIHIRNTGTHY
jgi:flavin reductase (DIM6/NTAB) family NADH-FMN oxidoreductase RutF